MASFEDIAIIAYAGEFSAVILLLVVHNFRSQIREAARKRYLTYLSNQPVISSRRLGTHWTAADILGVLVLLGLSSFWVVFRCPSLVAAGRRAATLAVTNLVFLCASPHLDCLTNTLGIQWRTLRRAHGSVGVLTAVLVGFHVAVELSSQSHFSIAETDTLWAVVVSLPSNGDA